MRDGRLSKKSLRDGHHRTNCLVCALALGQIVQYAAGGEREMSRVNV